jgi:predicted short-subunit dehydrogenase-like oxidoreductase (DUF2520 family)
MNIVIIGTGNTASVLGRKLKKAGHSIVQVVGRNSAAASELAYALDTISTNYPSAIYTNADIYLVAVADGAISTAVHDLNLPGKIVAHTAASVPMELLKNVSEHYGVFYPLQSLRKEADPVMAIPIFIDGSDEITVRSLQALAQSISGDKVAVRHGNDERTRLHVAAVFVNNFTNYLYVLAETYCRKEGIDFKLLQPLIEETALRVERLSPRAVQTGPAMRHDRATIEKHLQLLAPYPQLKKVYSFLSDSIEQMK